MAPTRRFCSWQLLALTLGLALAGCGTRAGSAGGLVKDSTTDTPGRAESTASTQDAAPRGVGSTAGAAERSPAGTGALEPAPARAVDPGAGGQRLSHIHFDFDSYLLNTPARSTLQENATYLADRGPGSVRVEGHCDERGSAEYNLALGERRAQSAVAYLQDLGISPERLQVVSYGEERPLDNSRSEIAWASNRRAEFVEVAR